MFGPCPDSELDPIQLLMPFEVIGHGTNLTFDGKLNATIDVAGPIDVSVDGQLFFFFSY
jgi:hypothetical protein